MTERTNERTKGKRKKTRRHEKKEEEEEVSHMPGEEEDGYLIRERKEGRTDDKNSFWSPKLDTSLPFPFPFSALLPLRGQ